MLKKVLAFLVAMVLALACMPALAETQQYTHPAMGYTLSAPAEWLIVDQYNVDKYIDAYNRGEMDFTGTNALTLNNLKGEVAATDCVVLMDPYANNVVVVGNDLGMTVNAEIFAAYLIPVLKEELKAQMPAITFMNEGEILSLGGKDFVLLSAYYVRNGITSTVEQMYYLEGSMMYVLNVTSTYIGGEDVINAFNEEVIKIAESFATAQ